MVANGVPNKGTATKVKVSARYVGREAMVITTPKAGSNWRPSAC